MDFYEYTDEMIIDSLKAFHGGEEPEDKLKEMMFATRDLCRSSYEKGVEKGLAIAAAQLGADLV